MCLSAGSPEFRSLDVSECGSFGAQELQSLGALAFQRLGVGVRQEFQEFWSFGGSQFRPL